MPRLRYVPTGRLEFYAAKQSDHNGAGRPPADDSAASFDHEGRRRIEAAGILALGPDRYREFLNDVYHERSVTERAVKYGVSRSTAYRHHAQELHDVRLAYFAIRLHEALRDSGGGTVDLATGEFLAPSPHYLVSLAAFGQCFDTLPSPGDILSWLQKHRRALSDPRRPLYQGVWHDPDRSEWRCDLNLLVAQRHEAFSIAVREGQRSVFDNSDRAILSVPRPERRTA